MIAVRKSKACLSKFHIFRLQANFADKIFEGLHRIRIMLIRRNKFNDVFHVDRVFL